MKIKNKYTKLFVIVLLLSCSKSSKTVCDFGKLKENFKWEVCEDALLESIETQKQSLSKGSVNESAISLADIMASEVNVRKLKGYYLDKLLKDSTAINVLDTLHIDSMYYLEFHTSGESVQNECYIVNFNRVECSLFKFKVQQSLKIYPIRKLLNATIFSKQLDAFSTVMDSMPSRFTKDDFFVFIKIYNTNCSLNYKSRVVVRPTMTQYLDIENLLN